MNVTETVHELISTPAEILAHGASFVAMGDSGDTEGSTRYKGLLADGLMARINGY